MNCLQNIIGLSRTNSPYYENEFSSDARKSTSGKYIDEIDEFPSLDTFSAVAKAEQKTLEMLFADARSSAIEAFKEELNVQLGMRYTVKSKPYIGRTSNTSHSGNLELNFPYAGQVLEMKKYKGASVNIKGIRPYFNFTGTLDISVYRALLNGYEYAIQEKVADITVNTHVTNPELNETNLVLNTMDDEGNQNHFLLIYNLPADIYPRNNKASCGCGYEEDMKKYFRVKGIVSADGQSFLTSNKTDYANGLVLEVVAMCTGGDFICNNYYQDPFVKTVVEHQIWRKAASIAMVKILTTKAINIDTMVNREALGVTINILNKKFEKNIRWLADNMNMLNNDCFSCNPTGDAQAGITKGFIGL